METFSPERRSRESVPVSTGRGVGPDVGAQYSSTSNKYTCFALVSYNKANARRSQHTSAQWRRHQTAIGAPRCSHAQPSWLTDRSRREFEPTCRQIERRWTSPTFTGRSATSVRAQGVCARLYGSTRSGRERVVYTTISSGTGGITSLPGDVTVGKKAAPELGRDIGAVCSCSLPRLVPVQRRPTGAEASGSYSAGTGGR